MARQNYIFYDRETYKDSTATTKVFGAFKVDEETAEAFCEKYDLVKEETELHLGHIDIPHEDKKASYKSHKWWKLDEEEENELFDAVCDRYSLSYGIEDKGYFDYMPHPDPDYDYQIRVKKWTAHRTKVHIGKARYDEEEERWVVAYDESSGWHG